MDFRASHSQSWPGPISLPRIPLASIVQLEIIDIRLRNSYNFPQFLKRTEIEC